MSLTPKASRPNMPSYGLLPADQGSGLKPWSYAVERLTRARGYWLSTASAEGRPHSMPVWAVWSRDHLLFSTSAQSRKAKNIAHNPYVVIGAEPSDDSIVLEGDAFLITDEAWKREFCQAYAAKYGWNMDDFSEPIYAVRPRLAFSFGTAEGEFLGGSTRWTFKQP